MDVVSDALRDVRSLARRRWRSLGALGVGMAMTMPVLAANIPGRQTDPGSLDQILQLSAQHVDRYARVMTNVVVQEDYQQVALARGSIGGITRRTRADMIVMDVEDGDAWVPFRDVYEVDGKLVRDRDERLMRLLGQSTPNSFEQALAITSEGARFNLDAPGLTLNRSVNTPMAALMFLRTVNRTRSTFRLGGTERLGGALCRIVNFTEEGLPSLIRSSEGASVRGRFWIEPASGHVHRSELLIDAAISVDLVQYLRARITVNYAIDAKLGFWVPVAMEESYDVTGGNQLVTGRAAYGNFRQFGVTTDTVLR